MNEWEKFQAEYEADKEIRWEKDRKRKKFIFWFVIFLFSGIAFNLIIFIGE